jgi:cell fate (sporulation/competence/biofilm development) regulator YmcA (YheA/YmcA/DUF963 family)
MPAPRKTKKEKALIGTLRKDREAARTKLSDPQSELQDAREALEAMKQNMRQATQLLAEKGLMVTTQIANTHGKFTEVQRVNPAVKVQREAMRAIKSLKRQITELEEEIKALPVSEHQESALAKILKSREERQNAVS